MIFLFRRCFRIIGFCVVRKIYQSGIYRSVTNIFLTLIKVFIHNGMDAIGALPVSTNVVPV